MRGIYFDHAAAAPVSSPIAALYMARLSDSFANQESLHLPGREARQTAEFSARKLSESLFEQPKEVFFAHTGTELFNVLSNLPRLKKGHVLTTRMEHPALLAALNRSGAEVEFVETDSGRIDPEALARKLRSDTQLVAAFHVHSEIGLVQNFSWIPVVRERAPRALILADTIQSAAKLELPEGDIHTLSGHKLGSPGGAALFYSGRNRELAEFFAGTRDPGYYSGRVEAPLLAALAAACSDRAAHRKSHFDSVRAVNRMLRRELPKLKTRSETPLAPTIPEEDASPYILHFLMPEYQSAVVLRMLSEKGVCVASSSACQAESGRPSAALAELGLKQYGFSGMRLSFGPESTLTEAAAFLDELQKILLNY